MKPTILAVVIGMTVSTNVLANEEFRSHEAHVHGKVEVNIAQDGQELLVEVTAPGADVVGFEHAPETAEQKKVFEHAIAQLNKPEELFGFNNAGCTLKFKSVTNTLEGDHDDHEGHDHSEGGHGEFTVEYHYQCSDIEKLDTVNTQWFSKFGNTKSMTVNLLTDSAQIQEILNAERISFQF
nr:DUF2796 domain-containing protein [Vibrio lentus]PMJ56584.1 hypothetical protein BCU20_19510 [Vibrio lentus]